MTNPLVSCIIPVYNGERFLSDAIRSILAQTHRPLEIIVVDDGSTDNTPEVANSFGDEVTYIHQANAGPATARNRGLQAATGDFIAFLDADDVWLETKLEKQLGRFRARPELGYSVTMMQNFWEEEAKDEEARFQEHRRSQPLPGYVTQTLLVRREWMEITGGFNVSLSHGDSADWFQRADAAGAIGELLPEVMARRRLHTANRSRLHSDRSRDEFLTILKARLDKKRSASP